MGRNNKGAGRLMCKAEPCNTPTDGTTGEGAADGGAADVQGRALQYPDRRDNGADPAGVERLRWLKNKTGRLLNAQPARCPIDG